MTLLEYLNKKKVLINKKIKEIMDNWDLPEPIGKAIRYILESGGKRIRPILTLLSCEAVGGSISSVMNEAIAIELLHNGSLLYDDVIDKDELRRGKITVHKKWNKNVALLSGGMLASKALELIADIPEVFELYSKTIGKMIEGQVLDISSSMDTSSLLFESKSEREIFEILRNRFRQKALEGMEWQEGTDLHLIADFTNFEEEREYFEMIAYKTAALMKLATHVGAMLGNGSQQQINALTNYGLFLGIAFQIRDDLIGVLSAENISGKPIGSDIRQGKLNLYTIFALRNLENDKLSEFLNLIRTPAGFNQVKKILIDSGAFDYAKEKLELLGLTAREQLSLISPSDSKEVLNELINFIIQRNF